MVLVIDDSKRVADAIVRSIRIRGMSAVAFASSSDACDAIREMNEPPEAAIIDVFMDRGSIGFDVARLLRRTFASPVPVLMITGHDCSEFRHDASELETAILEKPCSLKTMDAFLARAAVTAILPAASVIQVPIAWIAEHYGLVAQEARIVARLTAGSIRADLAHDLRISENTLKCQMRGVLAKLHLENCEQLVAFILRVLGGWRPVSAPGGGRC